MVRVEARLVTIGGTLADLRTRFDRAETRTDPLDGGLRGVLTYLATLAERIAHLPSKGFLWAAVLLLFGALSTVFLIAAPIRAVFGV